MPNHIINQIKTKTKEESEKIFSQYFSQKENNIDFNKIIPMPTHICQSIRSSEPLWYYWSIENWGTKWNAYETTRINENTFVFTTAWNGVIPIITKISKDFPKIKIFYKYSDEDTGYNCGSLEFLNGEIVKDYQIQDDSDEAYDICFELKPYMKDFYKKINGEWTYSE